ncbi:hypothetical protein [Aurantimonas sp. VKM B-3413]|uniref:hypothetical protein n=1 Tax=Aurantimonas sp. VKM B-3413 TaxID=2779401 RepID=UPI001E4F29A2|nr:hypothetical protein [Aurantimonas sp. VKM B-3413]MCB8839567.1 hypothetical protein [Aurantimonas sp. VKM B-3413]
MPHARPYWDLRMRRIAALLLPLALFAACQSGGPRASLEPVRPRGIEGAWSSVGGPVAYRATFNNGRFASIETATNGLLASGTYTDLGPGQVNILYTSETTKQQVAANCNQVEPNRLSCATSSGNRFELSRA